MEESKCLCALIHLIQVPAFECANGTAIYESNAIAYYCKFCLLNFSSLNICTLTFSG